MKKPDVLPDSRTTDRKGAVPSFLGWWVPIYCANCGEDGGMVPEENTTFSFFLCNGCVDEHGHIDGVYLEPDVIFWQKVHDEMREKHGRLLKPHEVKEVETANSSPLATLLREGRQTIGGG